MNFDPNYKLKNIKNGEFDQELLQSMEARSNKIKTFLARLGSA